MYPFFNFAVIFICTLNLCAGQYDEDPLVTIENGQLRGRMAYTEGENKTYYAFQGIPYAEPPLGNLRFRAPVKISNWSGIVNATEDGSKCVQSTDPVVGNEDCLFINVYTPSLTGTSRSVMVWIYGGAFVMGDSAFAFNGGPDYFLDQDVVYVSFNYRVGIFGFLSTEDTVVPGNWALKDQLLALQWVQTNIHHFGGNASDVTVFGQSAGAASVSYLLQSDKTKGLFHKAILQSGSSLCLWSLNRRARRTAFAIGSSLGIVTTRSSTLLQRLREVNYETLQNAASVTSTVITLENPLQGIFFGPVMEPDHEEAIVVNRSDELLQNGDFNRIPVLMGITSNEAAAVDEIPGILRLYLLTYDIAIENLAPYDLNSSFLQRFLAAIPIKFHYFGISPVAASTNAVIKFISDDQWNRPSRRMAQSMAQYVPLYFYKFSYEGGFAGVINGQLSGVGHSEDLSYLFTKNSPVITNTTANDVITRQRMTTLWTNFAKYSTPTPFADPLLQNIIWERVGNNTADITFLDINTNLTLQQNLFTESMQFYDGIYQMYGDPPFDTY